MLCSDLENGLTYLTPYRRHHEIAGAIAVGDQPNPNSRDLSVNRQLVTVKRDKRRHMEGQ